MTTATFPLVPDAVKAATNDLITRMQRRQEVGSHKVARKTAEIMRTIITSKWTNEPAPLETLRHWIKTTGRTLAAAQPQELAIGNIVRRCLYIVREETQNLAGGKEGHDLIIAQRRSLHNMLDQDHWRNTSTTEKPESMDLRDLKSNIIDALGELLDELKAIYSHMADQAVEHIHASEVILTIGKSKTVQDFLKAAGKTRKFHVIVAETAPSYAGHEMALHLSKSSPNIETTLVTDAAIFAMMGRVNKVIIGTHAVLANGGLVATSGTHMVAQAAQYHKVPVVVCTGVFKLTPIYFNDQDELRLLHSPAPMLKYDEAADNVHVLVPAYDYVPPELVSLFVTNQGGNHASYLYRLLAEYYNPEDYVL